MATMETKLLANPTDPAAWEQALYAFLAEKERRSGSRRTVESYSRMLQHFFGRTAKTPDVVTSADVMGWAYGKGLSGREPSAITIGARVACLSSFYHFLIRMGVLLGNPCDALERPKVQTSTAGGYTALAPPDQQHADGMGGRSLCRSYRPPLGRSQPLSILTFRLSCVITCHAQEKTHSDERQYYKDVTDVLVCRWWCRAGRHHSRKRSEED